MFINGYYQSHNLVIYLSNKIRLNFDIIILVSNKKLNIC